MKFIPKVVERHKGDYVESREFNDQNRDLYVDMSELFEKELALYARTKILSSMVDMANAGFQNYVFNNTNLPTINANSEFIYPDEGNRASVDKFYNEITIGLSDTRNVLLTDELIVRPEIEIVRSSDNLIFENIPKSITETRIKDIFEPAELPYVLRVRGVNERVNIKVDINSPFSVLDVNQIEFSPYPTFGGTELRGIDFTIEGEGVKPIRNPAGDSIDFSKDPNYYYKPLRFITAPRKVSRISIKTASDLYVTGSDASMLGIQEIKVHRVTFNSVSYIGFRIPASTGSILKSIKPVVQWYNTYLGSITFTVYENLENFSLKSRDILGTYDKLGKGLPISMNSDLYVLVKFESSINTSPQLLGFEYTID